MMADFRQLAERESDLQDQMENCRVPARVNRLLKRMALFRDPLTVDLVN